MNGNPLSRRSVCILCHFSRTDLRGRSGIVVGLKGIDVGDGFYPLNGLGLGWQLNGNRVRLRLMV